MDDGSPLLVNSLNFKDALNESLDSMIVEVGMRYGSPSIESAINKLEESGVNQIILCPMFPQYAQATTGSCITFASKILDSRNIKYKTITGFFREEFFIESVVNKIKSSKEYHDSEMILFSFHGLPERHVDKVYKDGLCKDNDCEHGINDENVFCYKATCYETAIQLAKRFKLKEEDYTVGFQSRLGRGWVEPFSDEIITDLAKKGAKKLLVFSPAFVADCLETIIEIGDEYQELFEEHGGEKVQLVESLNSSDTFVHGLKEMILKRSL